MRAKPRHVAAILRQQPQLANLITRSRQHRELLAQVRNTIPADLAAHCNGATLNGNVLHLQVDSPVWGARLRYHAPQLLSSLRTRQPGLASIKVQTRVPRPARASRSKPRHALLRRSRHAAEHLQQAARTIGDEGLCHALQRLAKTLSEKE